MLLRFGTIESTKAEELHGTLNSDPKLWTSNSVTLVAISNHPAEPQRRDPAAELPGTSL